MEELKALADGWWHDWYEANNGVLNARKNLAKEWKRESQQRIALHIEDKPPHGKFTPNQYLNYKKRAEFLKGKVEFMGYVDYATEDLYRKESRGSS